MEILKILNLWWTEKSISKRLANPYRRKTFNDVKKLLLVRQIILISGLRRVGKSTIMYQLMEELLNSKVKPENILYFSFDEKIKDPLEVLESYLELTKVDWKKEQCFIFFDEIQKLPDWSNKIKLLYDSFPNLKIVISGSSSFQLEREAKIDLTGRHFVIYLPPLEFKEYLDLRQSKVELDKIDLWKDEIKKEFENYLLRPFPEIVKYEELTLIKSYIKDNVIEKVLKIDLTKKFRHVNEDVLTRLIDMIYEKPGMYLNYDDLSKELKVSKKTLLQHIYYLEFAYIIRKVKNFRPRARTTSRKLQRAYPFHWSLGFGWNGKINLESIVGSYFDAKYYWRELEKEVDFLILDKKILPVEVKESTRIDKNELSSLVYFMKRFKINSGMLIYNGKKEKVKIGEVEIDKLPSWMLFLS